MIKKSLSLILLSSILFFFTNCNDDDITLVVLELEIEGKGTSTPAPGEYEYWLDAEVNISATPSENWKFIKWHGDVKDSDTSKTIVVMDKPKKVIAVFREKEE